ncbi:hypothetical protein B7494_g2382 [Chlorociboria aeruginascens]|nr:hypothetical protein B7494_g2382 [Chlorociboria aeruginascens]
MTHHSDLEAGINLPTIPAPVVLASAREPVRFANQARLRMQKRKPEVHPPRMAQASGQAEQFFKTLRAELGNGSREHCLFVCWENEVNDQRAVPLLIDDRDDEVSVYQDLVEIWYKRYGWWWKCIPFYEVQGVDEVKFRFLRKQENGFSVIIERLDIPGIKARLTSDLEDASAKLCTMMAREPYSTCKQVKSTGYWVHEREDCLGYEPFAETCYFQIELDSQRKLDRLELLSLPLQCFHDPKKAAAPRTLQGLAQESCIYRILEIRDNDYFVERVAEAKFRAIMIHAGFRRWRPFDIPTVAMIIVMLWKVSGGTWEAAFASAGLFIMLVSLPPRMRKYL